MKQIYADKYRQIGLKIAYYRKLRGLTQEELAEQVGLAPAFILKVVKYILKTSTDSHPKFL